MRRRLEITIFFMLMIFLAGVYSNSMPPVVVAVIDTPVDFAHPEISVALANDLLRETRLIDETGRERTWYELNQEAKAEFERRFNEKHFDDQVRFIDSISALKRPDLTTAEAFRYRFDFARGVMNYLLFRSFRSGLDLVYIYHHGTHVAGLAVKSLQQAKLITYPLERLPLNEKLSLREILSLDPNHFRDQIRTRFDQISEGLKKNAARVVNCSFGFSSVAEIERLSKQISLFQRIFNSKSLNRIAEQRAQIYTSELSRLIRENPQSVFVLATGNDGLDITGLSGFTGRIHEKNVVRVAALDQNGRLAAFSNHSSIETDIAALGVGAEGPKVGGGKIHMSGTSQAAPLVTNALAKIFEEKPSLSVQEAIGELLNQKAVHKSQMAKAVVNGRTLALSDDWDFAGFKLSSRVSTCALLF